jgi:allantoinase
LAEIARFDGLLIAHAEDPGVIEAAPDPVGDSYAGFLASRPAEAETGAIDRLIEAARDTGARVHVVHLAAADALPALRTARADGVRITVETCPHYLTFAAEEIGDGATDHKCAPPIRDSEAREGLWDALMASEIDIIASDHSPCPPEMKATDGDFFAAWGGIASLQLALPAVWTGAQARGIGVEMVAHWMSDCTAHLAGYDAHKGRIAPGYDADLVVWDPEASFVVDPARLFHRHKVTPYAGRELFGVVHQTYVCGRLAYDSAGHG